MATKPAGLLVAGALALASSADGFRCGNKLSSRGDHAARVLHYCGEPDSVESRVAVRGVFGAG